MIQISAATTLCKIQIFSQMTTLKFLGKYPIISVKELSEDGVINLNGPTSNKKIKRMKGEGYLGRRKNEEGKIVYDVQKAPKEMKSRCEHNSSAKYFECCKLSDDTRLEIFEHFWRLNREAKRCFVSSLVLKSGTVQKKTENSDSRRSYSFKYNLKK